MPADGARPPAKPKSASMLKLDELEKKLVRMDGTPGPAFTFSVADRKRITRYGIPAWLVYAARTAPDGALKSHLVDTIDVLVELRDKARPLLPDVAFATVRDEP